MSLPIFSKDHLRKQLLRERLALSASDWQHKSLQICHFLQQSPQFQVARVILTYTSVRQEPDLQSLIQHFPDKTWGLPRCVGEALTWHQWQWGDRLNPGAYGIQEPMETAALVPASQVDLMLIPAVGCDRNFYRLGYGGGYFDRLLGQPGWQSVFRVGIVFELGYLDSLPVDPWDQRLNAICTETGYQVAA